MAQQIVRLQRAQDSLFFFRLGHTRIVKKLEALIGLPVLYTACLLLSFGCSGKRVLTCVPVSVTSSDPLCVTEQSPVQRLAFFRMTSRRLILYLPRICLQSPSSDDSLGSTNVYASSFSVTGSGFGRLEPGHSSAPLHVSGKARLKESKEKRKKEKERKMLDTNAKGNADKHEEGRKMLGE